MTEPRPDAPSDPCREIGSIAAGLRARLEGESRAGLAAVRRATPAEVEAAKNAPKCGMRSAECGMNGNGRLSHSALRTPHSAPDSAEAARASPEAVAGALKHELAAHVHPAVRTLDLFEFGSAEAENVNRDEALARIAAEVAVCDRCRELAASRTHTVPGQGSPHAKLVFVGEGPGEEEDRQGLAFVGRAGELLTKMIEAIALAREQVFICNIIKCRPPANRTPMPDEASNCMPYLMRQLEIIRPKVICALGGTAAKWLLQTHDGITRLRGRFYPYRGAQLMPTFHPAYVLRNYTPDTRRKVYDDLLKVKAAMDEAK